MTLTRLVLAWLPVTAWFFLATFGIVGILGWAAAPPRVLQWRLVEAALVTLFASLWFDSLGAGEWWVLFLLVGILSAVPAVLVRAPTDRPQRAAALLLVCADVLRYVVAGGILAWRLG